MCESSTRLAQTIRGGWENDIEWTEDVIQIFKWSAPISWIGLVGNVAASLLLYFIMAWAHYQLIAEFADRLRNKVYGKARFVTRAHARLAQTFEETNERWGLAMNLWMACLGALILCEAFFFYVRSTDQPVWVFICQSVLCTVAGLAILMPIFAINRMSEQIGEDFARDVDQKFSETKFGVVARYLQHHPLQFSVFTVPVTITFILVSAISSVLPMLIGVGESVYSFMNCMYSSEAVHYLVNEAGLTVYAVASNTTCNLLGFQAWTNATVVGFNFLDLLG